MDIYPNPIPTKLPATAPDRSRTCGKRCWPGWHNAQMQQGGHDCWLDELWGLKTPTNWLFGFDQNGWFVMKWLVDFFL